MIMTFELHPEWVPLVRFANYEFGDSVMLCVLEREDGIWAPEGSSIRQEVDAVRGVFHQPVLGCEIRTICELIHEISVESVCQLRGINLIGSTVDAVLNMLGDPEIVWRPRDRFSRREWVGVIDDFGLVLSATNTLGPITAVTLRGPLSGHRARETLAVATEAQLECEAD